MIPCSLELLFVLSSNVDLIFSVLVLTIFVVLDQ